jgi:hypothetical protein
MEVFPAVKAGVKTGGQNRRMGMGCGVTGERVWFLPDASGYPMRRNAGVDLPPPEVSGVFPLVYPDQMSWGEETRKQSGIRRGRKVAVRTQQQPG